MTVFSYSQARQNLATLLDVVFRDGVAVIERRSGESFEIRPIKTVRSAFDVPGIKTKATTADIVSAVRESRTYETAAPSRSALHVAEEKEPYRVRGKRKRSS